MDVRRVMYQQRIYVDLQDLQDVCELIANLRFARGHIAGGILLQDVSGILAAVLADGGVTT